MLHILRPSLRALLHPSSTHSRAHSYFASALFDFILPRLLFCDIFFRVLFSGLFLYPVVVVCFGGMLNVKSRRIAERKWRKIKYLLVIFYRVCTSVYCV